MSQVQTVKQHPKPIKLADQVVQYAADKRSEIVAFAGSPQRADKFIADMKMLCVDENLRACSPVSIFMSSLNALQLRLSIVKQTGQGYVLPYKKDGRPEAQLQIGYKGWRLICKRAGYNVDCELVFDCDDFKVHMDETGKRISFSPDLENRDPENGVWCDKHLIGAVVWVSDASGTRPEYVTGKKLRFIRSKSKAPNSPAWREWTEEMYKAKAIKYVASKLPSENEDLARAVDIDNQGMSLEPEKIQPVFTVTPEIIQDGAIEGIESSPHDPEMGEVQDDSGMPEQVECKSGAIVRTGVECQKCEDKISGKCPHWAK